MTSPLDEAIRDFSMHTDDETEIFTTVKIFGWDLFRVFRDAEKNIIKIVLQKDGVFREFKVDIKSPHNQTEEGIKKWMEEKK